MGGSAESLQNEPAGQGEQAIAPLGAYEPLLQFETTASTQNFPGRHG